MADTTTELPADLKLEIHETFEGLVPESWCCIDCGMNTAPGMLNRAEMEKAVEGAGRQVAGGSRGRSSAFRLQHGGVLRPPRRVGCLWRRPMGRVPLHPLP